MVTEGNRQPNLIPTAAKKIWSLLAAIQQNRPTRSKWQREKEARIIIRQPKFLNTGSFLCSGLIADLGPFLSPGVVPAFSVLEAFPRPMFPSAPSALGSAL